jgi:hypothetical protein
MFSLAGLLRCLRVITVYQALVITLDKKIASLEAI